MAAKIYQAAKKGDVGRHQHLSNASVAVMRRVLPFKTSNRKPAFQISGLTVLSADAAACVLLDSSIDALNPERNLFP